MVNPNNNLDKKKEHFYETNNGKFLIGVIILILIALAIYFIIKSSNKTESGIAVPGGSDSSVTSSKHMILTNTYSATSPQ